MSQSILVDQIVSRYKGDFSPMHFNNLLDDNSPFTNNAILCLYAEDDIKIPHFHLMDINLDSPICLYEPKYIFHDNSKSIISNKQLEYLCKALDSKIDIIKNGTYWKWLCVIWDQDHEDDSYNENNTRPNYERGIMI